MKTIAENANDFASIRTMDKGNCIYVDKTDYFHRLITAPGKNLFFIARPRRFGKSLMITTFKYIFEGRRELFKGLKIDKTDYDWKVHPVIHIDFGSCAAATYAGFASLLPNVMRLSLEDSGFAYDGNLPPAANFMNAIVWHFNRGTPCVVLIDEYDDPVAKALANPDEAELVRNELAAIYGQVKGKTNMIRFLMITGVSKFTKMSVFSALSNLTDISPLPEYAEMLGYTEDELDEYFGEHMAAHAKVMGLTDDQYRAELKRWYNGYRFSPDKEVTVYNPVSTGLTFANPRDEFRGTWTATGRPSMLMNFIRREGLLAIDYENGVTARENDFDVTDIRNLRAVAMLYQTGYLTIKDYADGRYLLGVPDEEVRRDLLLLAAAHGRGMGGGEHMSARRSRPGSVLMEFIIVAPLMLILISMILQFAQIWIAREITAYAAYCACRSVLSAVSKEDAELGAQRAAELACSWMCLAGMPNAIRNTDYGSSEKVVLPKFHDRNLTVSTEEFDESKQVEETVYFDDGAPVKGEIVIPGWGSIPGSDSSGSRNPMRYDRWEHGDRRVKTMIVRAHGYVPVEKSHDGFVWLSDDEKVRYALVRVKFKFPLLLPLAGRMISWFVSPNAPGLGGSGDLGRAGTVDYGSHELTGGNKPAWHGEETVMDEGGELVDRSSVQWGFDQKFPTIELTEFCMLPMPYSVNKGFGESEHSYSDWLPKVGEDT